MKSATLSEIKRALSDAGEDRLVEVALRLAKLKVENKELLTYLLFEEADEPGYVSGARLDIEEAFAAILNTNLYYFKKSIRKILRMVNRLSKFSAKPQTEVELRLHFCLCLQNQGVDFRKSPVIQNLFEQQVKKIDRLMKALPEDLRLDFQASRSQIKG